MESIKQIAVELYNEVMLDIKTTRSKFKKIIKTINNDLELKNLFTPEINTHLKHLIKMWRNNKEANIEFYFKLKEHHTHITSQIQNITFENMWSDYLSSCCLLRMKLLKLNDLLLKIPEFQESQELLV